MTGQTCKKIAFTKKLENVKNKIYKFLINNGTLYNYRIFIALTSQKTSIKFPVNGVQLIINTFLFRFVLAINSLKTQNPNVPQL